MLPLEAVTVCVGYADFLREVAPYNRPHLDRWLIVTEPTDDETREVCRRYELDVVLSEDGRRGDADFAKGRLIERGLQLLAADTWRLHLDADVALPGAFQTLLEAAQLREDTIYGADRVLVRSWEEWQQLQASGYLRGGQHDYHCRVNFPAHLPVGARWATLATGYVPIGFFQLWNGRHDQWRGIRNRPYPTRHNNACRTDVQHGLQWDRHLRQLLPEVIVVHLESEPAKLGANWNGRTTARFGPRDTAPAGAVRAAGLPS